MLLQAAIEHGEIEPSNNVEIVLDMLYGPVYFQISLYKKEVDSN